MQKLGYVEIKTWIINQYHHIRVPLDYVALTESHVSEYGSEMQQDRHKAHICQVAIVAHTHASGSRHKVASEETELSLAVDSSERLHKPRRMKVATCLTGNKIIFHL